MTKSIEQFLKRQLVSEGSVVDSGNVMLSDKTGYWLSLGIWYAGMFTRLSVLAKNYSIETQAAFFFSAVFRAVVIPVVQRKDVVRLIEL